MSSESPQDLSRARARAHLLVGDHFSSASGTLEDREAPSSVLEELRGIEI